MATAAARRYARAVYELAHEEGSVAGWAHRLEQLREVMTDSDVVAVLTNPTIPLEQRMELVSIPRLDPEAVNLAKLLIESNRVEDAVEIDEEFQRLDDESEGRVRATVTTAVELSSHERERVASELAERLGKKVRLRMTVDPRIVGGLKLQYGDRLLDATVATRLQQLRRLLAAS